MDDRDHTLRAARQLTGLLVLSATVFLASVGIKALSAQAATRTVWDGVYSAEQALRGKERYLASCTSCHQQDLRGDGMAPALIGADFMLQWSDLSANDLYVRMRNSMPQDNPRGLDEDVYVDILAYMFEANKFPAGKEPLEHGSDVLKAITITKQKP